MSQQKRSRERAQQEKRQLKAQKRAEAKQKRGDTPGAGGGEDPDIAGIVPGPQPSPWNEE
jgi:hypothetical protein